MDGTEPALGEVEWTRLDRLRAKFLVGGPGEDYWSDGDLVRAYDRTFGERIRWKWREVLAEAKRRGFAGGTRVLDYGCGSGVAGREFFRQFEAGPGAELILWDRSLVARRTAAELAEAEFAGQGGPTITARHAPPTEALEADVVLISHVLAEIDGGDLAMLLQTVARARAVLWVEPGTREVARRLVDLREELAADFTPIAPCPHRGACPLARPERSADWCHLFATPDPESFTSAHWRRFSDNLGVDLRSLPMSYLVLVRPDDAGPAPAGDLGRPLGRPKLEKGRALLDLCVPGDVRRVRWLERTDRRLFRSLRGRRAFHPLLRVELDGDHLVRMEPVDGFQDED